MEEDDEYREYEVREHKIEKLIAKNYQSKIRGNSEFDAHLSMIEKIIKNEDAQTNDV